MKKIIPVILVSALVLGIMMLTGCGETLSETTTGGLNLDESLMSGIDEGITDVSEALTDLSDEMTDEGEETNEDLPEDTTVSEAQQ